MLFFTKEKNAAVASKEIESVYEKELSGESICRKWFSKFKDLNYLPRSGRPKEVLLHQDYSLSIRELAKRFNVTLMTVENCLHELGRVNKV